MLDGLKLAIAGLMVIFDIFGFANPNALVLDYCRDLGILDPYQINVIPAKLNYQEVKPIELAEKLPYREDPFSEPVILAEAVVVMDGASGAILYEKNADDRRAMASTTKLMTAMVVLDNLSPDDIVTVIEEDTLVEPMKMWLVPGEKISVDSLIKALLIPSYNDAALVLARAVGDGSIENFVTKMNEKATEIGLANTHFANPHGLDAVDHYTNAKELAMIARLAMQNKYIRDIVATKDTIVYSEDGNSYPLKNTNELLDSYLDVRGAKTGFTDNAGQVLVTRALGEDENEIIVVTMNSQDRFQESKILIDWTFRTYYWD